MYSFCLSAACRVPTEGGNSPVNRQTMVCESAERARYWPPFALLIGRHFASSFPRDRRAICIQENWLALFPPSKGGKKRESENDLRNTVG
jgi:hypothetical protein